MAAFPKNMKPIGYTVKRQEGDFLVTYEVVGWNARNESNVWQEKVRKWNPRPSLSQAVAAMERDLDFKITKDLHNKVKNND